MQTPDWIAVDWGTSNMRAWAMSASGTVLAEVRSDKGMGDLTPDQFEDAFRTACDQRLGYQRPHRRLRHGRRAPRLD